MWTEEEKKEFLKKVSEGLGIETARLSKIAMETMGYIIVAEDGWIIKKWKDGRIDKLNKI